MHYSDRPENLTKPWASDGNKNSIPVLSQVGVTAGAASWSDGFPPLTMTPLAAGGIPPSGLDMNGVLHALSAQALWASSGAGVQYNFSWANDPDINGYPKGAKVLNAQGTGYWMSTIDNNKTDPDAGPSGDWISLDTVGAAFINLTGSSHTLTPGEYAHPLLVLTGQLTSNLLVIFPPSANKTWHVVNLTTGDFSISATTSNTGASVPIAPSYSTGGVKCVTSVTVIDNNCFAEYSEGGGGGGSTVIANPEGTGEPLSTISIEGVVYTISGGGGYAPSQRYNTASATGIGTLLAQSTVSRFFTNLLGYSDLVKSVSMVKLKPGTTASTLLLKASSWTTDYIDFSVSGAIDSSNNYIDAILRAKKTSSDMSGVFFKTRVNGGQWTDSSSSPATSLSIYY